MGGEVDVAGDRGQGRQPRLLADVEERFELPRLAVQPVEVPDDDGIDLAVADVVEHPAVLRPELAGVGAPVVVDVDLADRPAAALGEALAILDLAGHAQLVTVRVGRDASVDRSGVRH